MTRLALLAIVISAPAFADDQIWTWTDEKGEEHYTNDQGSIPEKFRSKVKSTAGAELSVVKPYNGPSNDLPPPKGTVAPVPVPVKQAPARQPNGTIRIVLFEASTNSASKTLQRSGVLEKLVSDNPGLKLERVEFATAVDRAEKMGVNQLPTVLFVDGTDTVIARSIGLVTLKELQSKLDKARGTSE